MNARLVLLGMSALMVCPGGCKEEHTFGEVFDDLVDEGPNVCAQYCDEFVDCQWLGDGPFEDAARESMKEECKVTCSYHMTNGCQLVMKKDYDDGSEEDWDVPDPDYEIVGEVSGSNVLAAFECIWALDQRACDTGEYNYNHYIIFDRWSISTWSECSKISGCLELLGISQLPSFYWDESASFGYGCLYQAEDWYIDYIATYGLTCGMYFPGTGMRVW